MILVISNCNILIFTSGGMGSKQRLWSRSWHHLTFYRNPLTARQRKRIVSRGEERGVRNLVRRLLFLWFTLPHSPSGPHLGFSELSVLRNKENSRPTEAQVIYYQQRDQNHRAGGGCSAHHLEWAVWVVHLWSVCSLEFFLHQQTA